MKVRLEGAFEEGQQLVSSNPNVFFVNQAPFLSGSWASQMFSATVIWEMRLSS